MSHTSAPARIGKYQVQRLLGSGGMGRVYQALDPDIGRAVAIKQITLAADPQARERFVSEARTMGRLNHPNITTLLEFNAEAEPPFLVLELLSGEDLSQWLLRPHTLREQLRVLADMARGLEAAHRAGILHRDLKPDNVRVLDNGHAKLLDFGIAQAGRSGLTAAGYFVGTPEFVAPEVMAGEAHSPAADLYALGLCCYVVLTGDNPFRGDTVQATVARVIQRVPPPIGTRVCGVPEALAALIYGCLAKQAADRPANAGVLADVLERCWREVPEALCLRDAPRPAGTLPQGVPTTPAPTRSTPVPAPRRSARLALAALAVLGGALLWWFWPAAVPLPEPQSTVAAEPPPMPAPARLIPVAEPPVAIAPPVPAASDAGARAAPAPRSVTADTPTPPEIRSEPAPATATAPADTSAPDQAEVVLPAEPAAATSASPVVPEPIASVIQVTVHSVEPNSLRAGRSYTVRIAGTHLGAIRTVQVGAGLGSDPRFRIGDIRHDGEGSLQFPLSVARGVPLGSYALQLSGPDVHVDPLIIKVSL